MRDSKANTSVLSGLGLALLGTTCCALPIVLVAVGAGAAMASLVSVFPWMVPLSQHKHIVFGLTICIQGYAWWRLHHVTQCNIADAKQLRWQRKVLWFSTIILVVSILAAYAAYPFVLWLESRGGE